MPSNCNQRSLFSKPEVKVSHMRMVIHRSGAAVQSPRPLPRGSTDGADAAGMSDPAILPILHGDIEQPTTVRGQTPAASATASGVCPLSTCRTIRSRPRGVSRAFLCTFIRSFRESLEPRNSSFLGQDRVDNLMKAHSEKERCGATSVLTTDIRTWAGSAKPATGLSN
jgi:hypothetical protein